MRDGPTAGLALIDAILARGELADYYLAHAARADLCRRLGQLDAAQASYRRALDLARQQPEREFLERRLNDIEAAAKAASDPNSNLLITPKREALSAKQYDLTYYNKKFSIADETHSSTIIKLQIPWHFLRRPMRHRRLIIGLAICSLILVAAGAWLVNHPALVYRLTGSEHYFATAIKETIPKGCDVGHLESLVGQGTPTAPPDWMLRWIDEKPNLSPDGWREGDKLIRYDFSGSTWYFQIRDGHLVNYDPNDVVIDRRPITSLSAPTKKT